MVLEPWEVWTLQASRKLPAQPRASDAGTAGRGRRRPMFVGHLTVYSGHERGHRSERREQSLIFPWNRNGALDGRGPDGALRERFWTPTSPFL